MAKVLWPSRIDSSSSFKKEVVKLIDAFLDGRPPRMDAASEEARQTALGWGLTVSVLPTWSPQHEDLDIMIFNRYGSEEHTHILFLKGGSHRSHSLSGFTQSLLGRAQATV